MSPKEILQKVPERFHTMHIVSTLEWPLRSALALSLLASTVACSNSGTPVVENSNPTPTFEPARPIPRPELEPADPAHIQTPIPTLVPDPAFGTFFNIGS